MPPDIGALIGQFVALPPAPPPPAAPAAPPMPAVPPRPPAPGAQRHERFPPMRPRHTHTSPVVAYGQPMVPMGVAVVHMLMSMGSVAGQFAEAPPMPPPFMPAMLIRPPFPVAVP